MTQENFLFLPSEGPYYEVQQILTVARSNFKFSTLTQRVKIESRLSRFLGKAKNDLTDEKMRRRTFCFIRSGSAKDLIEE